MSMAFQWYLPVRDVSRTIDVGYMDEDVQYRQTGLKGVAMKTARIAMLALSAVAVISSSSSATLYSGDLTTANGGLVGKSAWENDSSIKWWVSETNQGWLYKYQLTMPRKDVSHFSIEVSDCFTQNDIWGATVNGKTAQTFVDTYGPGLHGNSDPTIPGILFGVKLESEYYTTENVVEFYSSKAPVWGDFYAVGGKNTTPANSLWNEGFKDWNNSLPGFQDYDPIVAASNGSVQNHILRPDTMNHNPPAVPEAGTLALAFMGMAPVIAMRKKLSKR